MLIVDWGSERIKVAFYQGTTHDIPFGQHSYFPSCVYVDEDGDVEVGWEAANMIPFDEGGSLPSVRTMLHRYRIFHSVRQKSLLVQDIVTQQLKEIIDTSHKYLRAKNIEKNKLRAINFCVPVSMTRHERAVMEAAAKSSGCTDIQFSVADTLFPRLPRVSYVLVVDYGAQALSLSLVEQDKRNVVANRRHPSLGAWSIQDVLLEDIQHRLYAKGKRQELAIIEENLEQVRIELESCIEHYSQKGTFNNKKGLELVSLVIPYTKKQLKDLLEKRVLAQVVDAIQSFLDSYKYDVAISFKGGGSNLYGLEAYCKKNLSLPCHVLPQPEKVNIHQCQPLELRKTALFQALKSAHLDKTIKPKFRLHKIIRNLSPSTSSKQLEWLKTTLYNNRNKTKLSLSQKEIGEILHSYWGVVFGIALAKSNRELLGFSDYVDLNPGRVHIPKFGVFTRGEQSNRSVVDNYTFITTMYRGSHHPSVHRPYTGVIFRPSSVFEPHIGSSLLRKRIRKGEFFGWETNPVDNAFWVPLAQKRDWKGISIQRRLAYATHLVSGHSMREVLWVLHYQWHWLHMVAAKKNTNNYNPNRLHIWPYPSVDMRGGTLWFPMP